MCCKRKINVTRIESVQIRSNQITGKLIFHTLLCYKTVILSNSLFSRRGSVLPVLSFGIYNKDWGSIFPFVAIMVFISGELIFGTILFFYLLFVTECD